MARKVLHLLLITAISVCPITCGPGCVCSQANVVPHPTARPDASTTVGMRGHTSIHTIILRHPATTIPAITILAKTVASAFAAGRSYPTRLNWMSCCC